MKVTVQLASARAANVRLSYQVRGPSWQPSYRAQLSTVKSQVQLERQALVVQASGEDWSNVSLRLSTGQPTRSTQGALPRPWVVDVVQPHAVFGTGLEGGGSSQHRGIHGVNAKNDASAVGQLFLHLLGGENAARVVAYHFQPGLGQTVKQLGIGFAERTGCYKNFHKNSLCGYGQNLGREPAHTALLLCGYLSTSADKRKNVGKAAAECAKWPLAAGPQADPDSWFVLVTRNSRRAKPGGCSSSYGKAY